MYLLSMYLLGIIKRFTSSLLEVLNKHAPLKQLSQREKKLSLKPWITKGIYNSIKTKIDHLEYVTNMEISIK